MDLADRIAQLSARIEKQHGVVLTEEAAKTAFVLPFLQGLGYDVFNPLEVIPEFISDVGTKKGEKVDYAISLNGEIQILIECKPIGAKLELKHANQLFRYFSVTTARFGVLTDGIRYCFYTDLDAANKMDERPFFTLNLLDIREQDIVDLKKFTKDAFDVEAIVSTAADMKYQRSLADEIKKEFNNPSDDFTRLIAGRVYGGRFTQGMAEKFSLLLKRAISEHIRERVDSRLKGALESKSGDSDFGTDDEADSESGIVTTELEVDGFKIVRAISSEVVEPERIVMRDAKSYCSVLLDDNNRKPIVRLLFNNENNLRLQIFDQESPPRTEIAKVTDLYQHRASILAALARYLAPNQRPTDANSASAEGASHSPPNAGQNQSHTTDEFPKS